MYKKDQELSIAFETEGSQDPLQAVKLNKYGYVFDDLKLNSTQIESLEFDDRENFTYRKNLLKLLPNKNLFSKNSGDKSKTSKKSLLINLSRVNPSFNGTAKYSIALINNFIRSYGDKFKISVLIPKKSYQAHKKWLKFSSVEVLYPENEESWVERVFDISFSISQFMELSDLAIVARHSKRIAFILLDYIGIKATYIDRLIVGRGEYSPFKLNLLALEFTDAVTSISQTSLDDIQEYTKKLVPNVDFYKNPIQLSVPVFDSEDSKTSSASKDNLSLAIEKFIAKNTEFVFIMGNGFHHKAVPECAREVQKTKLKFIQVHSELKELEGGNLSIPSGGIPEDLLHKIYSKAKFIIFPSIYEGLGLPILEAVQDGKIVLAINNNLNQELIKEYDLDSRQIILFDKFSDLQEPIKKANKLYEDIQSGGIKFKTPLDLADWQRPTEQTFKFIQNSLAKNVDEGLIYRRALSLNLMEDLYKENCEKQAHLQKLNDHINDLRTQIAKLNQNLEQQAQAKQSLYIKSKQVLGKMRLKRK